MGIDETSKPESGSVGVWGIAQVISGRKLWGTKFINLPFQRCGASHHSPRRKIPFSRAHSTNLDVLARINGSKANGRFSPTG